MSTSVDLVQDDSEEAPPSRRWFTSKLIPKKATKKSPLSSVESVQVIEEDVSSLGSAASSEVELQLHKRPSMVASLKDKLFSSKKAQTKESTGNESDSSGSRQVVSWRPELRGRRAANTRTEIVEKPSKSGKGFRHSLSVLALVTGVGGKKKTARGLESSGYDSEESMYSESSVVPSPPPRTRRGRSGRVEVVERRERVKAPSPASKPAKSDSAPHSSRSGTRDHISSQEPRSRSYRRPSNESTRTESKDKPTVTITSRHRVSEEKISRSSSQLDQKHLTPSHDRPPMVMPASQSPPEAVEVRKSSRKEPRETHRSSKIPKAALPVVQEKIPEPPGREESQPDESSPNHKMEINPGLNHVQALATHSQKRLDGDRILHEDNRKLLDDTRKPIEDNQSHHYSSEDSSKRAIIPPEVKLHRTRDMKRKEKTIHRHRSESRDPADKKGSEITRSRTASQAEETSRSGGTRHEAHHSRNSHPNSPSRNQKKKQVNESYRAKENQAELKSQDQSITLPKGSASKHRNNDLVYDSKLDTVLVDHHNNSVRHTLYISSHGARRRPRRIEETWKRREKIGSGTFGKVWLQECVGGEDKGRLRAVKEITKRRREDGSLSIEYNRELEAIAKFSQSKYVHCFAKSFGWYENRDSIFITMEYFENGDLQRYLNRPFPEFEVKEIVYQLLEGLRFMHKSSFAHRDLKPANILVSEPSPNWWVKITDFGISKRAEQESTAFRTFAGTKGYLAPEVMAIYSPDDEIHEDGAKSKEIYTDAVDLWALGVIMFQLLTNKVVLKDPRELWEYVNGRRLFPEGILDEHNTSDPGKILVKDLMAPSPGRRPSASKALDYKWLTDIDDAAQPRHTVDTSTNFPHPKYVVSTDSTSTASLAWPESYSNTK